MHIHVISWTIGRVTAARLADWDIAGAIWYPMHWQDWSNHLGTSALIKKTSSSSCTFWQSDLREELHSIHRFASRSEVEKAKC